MRPGSRRAACSSAPMPTRPSRRSWTAIGPRPTASTPSSAGCWSGSSALFPQRRIRAFGEMVDLLCERGNPTGAARLEELWNRLARRRSFSLLCGYRIDVFDRDAQISVLPEICRSHSHVLPVDDPARLERRRRRSARGGARIAGGPGLRGPRRPAAQEAGAAGPARPDVGQLADAALGRADPRVGQGALPAGTAEQPAAQLSGRRTRGRGARRPPMRRRTPRTCGRRSCAGRRRR